MALASLACLACTPSSFSIALSLSLQYLLPSCTGRGNPRLLTAAPHDHHPSLMLWPRFSSAEEHCCGSAAPFTDPQASAMNKQNRQSVVLSGLPLMVLVNRSDQLNFLPSHLCCKIFFELIISKKTKCLTRAEIFVSFSDKYSHYSPILPSVYHSCKNYPLCNFWVAVSFGDVYLRSTSHKEFSPLSLFLNSMGESPPSGNWTSRTADSSLYFWSNHTHHNTK